MRTLLRERPEVSIYFAMDAPNPSATPTFANRTPVHIGAVGLKVRDLDRVTGFYRDVLGLTVLDRDKDRTALGAGLDLSRRRQQRTNAGGELRG